MLMESLTVSILLVTAIGVVLLEGFHFRAPFKRQRIVLMMGILLYIYTSLDYNHHDRN